MKFLLIITALVSCFSANLATAADSECTVEWRCVGADENNQGAATVARCNDHFLLSYDNGFTQREAEVSAFKMEGGSIAFAYSLGAIGTESLWIEGGQPDSNGAYDGFLAIGDSLSPKLKCTFGN